MKIIIPDCPISQIRMKFSSKGGFGRIYDPREKEKTKLKSFLTSNYSGKKFEFPRISFVFHMPIPKSIPKKQLPIFKSGMLKHTKKPDVDNLIKLYLDCLDGICFDGDQKVNLGDSVKLYHPFPKTIIIINNTQELLNPLEVDPLTWYLLFGKESGRCSYDEMVCLDDSYTPDQLEYSQYPDYSFPIQNTSQLETLSFVLPVKELKHQVCK